MSNHQSKQSHWNSKVKKNVIHLNCWTSAWVLSIALLSIGPQLIWNFNTAATLLAGFINLTIGIAMIAANIRFVNSQDELQQRIFLEAAAITLGVLVICGGSYQLWGDIKLISFEPQVWHLMCVMGLTFVIGMAAVTRRYR